jgi:hypothetical protein
MNAKVTDAVFVACCLTLTGIAVAGFLGRHKETTAREGVVRGPAPLLAAAGMNQRYAVVIYIEPDCPYCTASLPFYRRLSAAVSGTNATLRFQSPAASGLLRGYLDQAGLQRAAIVSAPLPNGVRAIPTVVVINAEGGVVASWEGRMSQAQERTLLKHFEKSEQSGSRPAGQGQH